MEVVQVEKEEGDMGSLTVGYAKQHFPSPDDNPSMIIERKRYLSLSKSPWTGYVNGLDGTFDVEAKIDSRYAAFCGVNSYHNNAAADRRFRFRYCEMTDEPAYSQGQLTFDSPWSNNLDGSYVDCPADSVITKIYSFHSNEHEDRRWQYSCRKFEGLMIDANSCSWSAWANNYDGLLNFECGDGRAGVITGIQSQHSAIYRDRIFKFKCCNWEYIGCRSLNEIPASHATPGGAIKYDVPLYRNRHPIGSVATFGCPYNPFGAYFDTTTCQSTFTFDKDPASECASNHSPVPTDFRILPNSFDQCPSSMYLSRQDCATAVLTVGGRLRDGGVPSGSFGDRPFGCSMETKGDQAAHYNTFLGENAGYYESVCGKGRFMELPKLFEGECPLSMHISKEECAAAGLSVGGRLNNGNLIEGVWDTAPFGCSISYEDNDAVYYNGNADGVNDGRFSSLCLEPAVSILHPLFQLY